MLALYVFMADSLRVVHHGLDAAATVLPQSFNWSMFCLAFTLMAAPVAQAALAKAPIAGDIDPETCGTP